MSEQGPLGFKWEARGSVFVEGWPSPDISVRIAECGVKRLSCGGVCMTASTKPVGNEQTATPGLLLGLLFAVSLQGRLSGHSQDSRSRPCTSLGTSQRGRLSGSRLQAGSPSTWGLAVMAGDTRVGLAVGLAEAIVAHRPR